MATIVVKQKRIHQLYGIVTVFKQTTLRRYSNDCHQTEDLRIYGSHCHQTEDFT